MKENILFIQYMKMKNKMLLILILDSNILIIYIKVIYTISDVCRSSQTDELTGDRLAF